MANLKVKFLGTPDFVSPVLKMLQENFVLVEDDPDLIIVAAFGKILTREELETAKYGALNVHPSLLPKYRGPSPIQAAILNGDKISGVTIMKLDEQMDHGPILAQKEITISPNETYLSFAEKAFREGALMLKELIPDYIAGALSLTPQEHEQATYCKLIKKADGYFEIDNPPSPERLDKMIRAYYPWPGVWTKFKEKVVKLYPGGQIQMEGKKITELKSFLNGYPDFPIKNL